MFVYCRARQADAHSGRSTGTDAKGHSEGFCAALNVVTNDNVSLAIVAGYSSRYDVQLFMMTDTRKCLANEGLIKGWWGIMRAVASGGICLLASLAVQP